MVQLSKSELIPLIVAHYRKQLQESTYQMYLLSQKYQCSFEELEALIPKKSEEDFVQWDDYIDWKGHRKSAQYLSENIPLIEGGRFPIA